MANDSRYAGSRINSIPIFDKKISKYYPEGRSLYDRFWSFVRVAGPDDCWEWQGGRRNTGYGMIGYFDSRTQATMILAAHRLSYRIHFGLIPDDLFVLHECDNPPCVNPRHLHLGTAADNMQECIDRGRHYHVPDPEAYRRRMMERAARLPYVPAPRFGSDNGKAKLTAEDVREIRRLAAEGIVSQKEIAARFGITQGNANHIIHRKSWRHVE